MLPVFSYRKVTEAPAVLFRLVNRVAIISMNRSDSLNVLSHDTVLVISAEPPRILWRLQLLREWSDEQEGNKVFPGSPGARSASGARAA
ncbi:enoyl-CoA hydratase/isomerase family protein [Paraburkholderia dipogonis]|uniref:Enoyl-CoA hydratase/isomerase family protein n=1 Tax=Paraburkholderia dipogonis TaxID=1211383 RepID=A0A4Y8MJ75_9BURK|nr:enoyl-CoA hydratase/isomerase family protein [Paraburkholderia dipogonis]